MRMIVLLITFAAWSTHKDHHMQAFGRPRLVLVLKVTGIRPALSRDGG